MTELLYLHDSYLKEFSAKITGINGETVSLDKTAFFPAGGGQPSDTGKIFFSEKEFSVI
ncbi:MAG: alanine--tRNA ligase-related protein, partial [archaeon]